MPKPSYSSLYNEDCSICEWYQTFTCKAASPVLKSGIRCHYFTCFNTLHAHTCRSFSMSLQKERRKGWSSMSGKTKINFKVSQAPLSYYLNTNTVLITGCSPVGLLKVKLCLLICRQDIITPLVLRSVNHYSGCL